jgi:DNA-binding FrmR family transcriptional regulator
MQDAAGCDSRRRDGLMAEILEDHIRLHMMNPDREMESSEELGEDLIGLVRAYLK